MEKWFEDKFEREKMRKYTQKRIKGEFLNGFFRKLSITNWLIIVNVILYALYSLIESIGVSIYGTNFSNILFSYIAIQPNLFFHGYVWTVLTSMFMHGSVFHLFVNMFSLFFIGNFIEKLIGRKRFFLLYLFAGLFAGLFFATLSYFFGSICIMQFFGGCLGAKIFSSPITPAVGASGAIFALAGLLAILTPKNRVYLIAGPLIAIVIQAIASNLSFFQPYMPTIDTVVTVYFIFSIISMFSFNTRIRRISLPIEMPFWLLPFVAIIPLIIIGLFVDLPIGNTAHLGGLLFGICYGIYLKKRYKHKTEMISRMFSK
jgi:membrane associated rhomboid family serine protease